MGNNLPIVDLGTGRTAQALSSEGLQTCALLDDFTLKCWGDNEFGQLGQGLNNTIPSDKLGNGAGEMGDDLPPIDLGTQ